MMIVMEIEKKKIKIFMLSPSLSSFWLLRLPLPLSLFIVSPFITNPKSSLTYLSFPLSPSLFLFLFLSAFLPSLSFSLFFLSSFLIPSPLSSPFATSLPSFPLSPFLSHHPFLFLSILLPFSPPLSIPLIPIFLTLSSFLKSRQRKRRDTTN